MKVTVPWHNFEIQLNEDLGSFLPSLVCEESETPGIYFVNLRITSELPEQVPHLILSWDLPSIDIHHKWNALCMQNRALDPSEGSCNFVQSASNFGMPVYSLYNLEGINTCTWALSDVIHETRLGGSYIHGKVYRCSVEVRGDAIGETNEYSVSLRFDFRQIPYYEALGDVAVYWENLPGGTPCTVPDAARVPLLSSWYIYALDIDPDDLEKQCSMARDMGIGTVILDDGWQTNQRTFGYQNNGDWEVEDGKLPDFAGHVKRVQDLGLKYMVWFSVPFVGIESKAYERFKDMLLPANEGATHFCLDPRYPEVREHIAATLADFVDRYGVDGLKLDFIGTIRDRDSTSQPDDSRRDFTSIGKAVCSLLSDVSNRLRNINSEILIEFRQAYNGPAMRRFANIFRAVDCPNSIGDNRVRTLDIRLLSGNTAVHTDPITWHDDEPDHSAAMQIIHGLFAVPQISRKISELSGSHRQMLTHQMAFCREHRDVLLCGDLRPLYPHLLYPLVVAKIEHKMLAAFYADLPFRPSEEIPEVFILVNGSYTPEVLIDLQQPIGRADITVVDCLGTIIRKDRMDIGIGLQRIAIPVAGHARINRIDRSHEET